MPVGPSGIQLPTGATLHNESYCIEAILGRGGFGITYRATDMRLQMPVAIKEFCPPGCMRRDGHIVATASWPAAMHAEGLRRFMQEGRTLARFHHPNIVRVLFMFEENGTGYLVMEMVEGETLEALLKRTGILMPRKGLELARRVGEALIEVHKGGLLHLDIKPSNIIHTADDRYVLVDFGTARQFVAMSAKPQSVFLTPGYSPPEQYSERAPRTRASDVYSLAATLYHLLTGEMPPTAADRALGGGELQPLRSLNPLADVRMEQAIMRALTLDTRDRTSTMEEFMAELGVSSNLALVAAEPVVGASSGSMSALQGGVPGAPGASAVVVAGPLASHPTSPRADSGPVASCPLPVEGAESKAGGEAAARSVPPGGGEVRQGEAGRSSLPGGSQAGSGTREGATHSPWRRFAPFLCVALVLILAFVLVELLSPSPKGGGRVSPFQATPLAVTPLAVTPPSDPSPGEESPSPGPLASATPPPSPSAIPVESPLPLSPSPAADVSPSPASPGVASPEGAATAQPASPGAAPASSPAPRFFTQSPVPIESLAWSDDGSLLAAGDRRGVVWVWDARARTPKVIETAQAIHAGAVKSLSFSPDGRMLASVDTSSQSPVYVWDVPTAKIVKRMGGTRSGRRVAFSKDGRTLALTEDFNFGLYDVTTGLQTARLGPADGLTEVFSADGSLVGAAFGSTVRLWGPSSGGLLRQIEVPGGVSVSCLALSVDGKSVAVGGADGSLFFWGADAAAGPTFTIGKAYTGTTVDVAISLSGAVVTADGRAVTVRDGARGEVRHRLEISQGIADFALSPDCTRLALGYKDGAVLVHDVSEWGLGLRH